MVAFRCPHCGAEISFDPSLESMKCEYCGSEITIEDYKASLTDSGYYTTNELSCTQCGAVIYSTDTTMATFCSYCGSSVLLRNRIVKEKRPDYIIPFSVTRETAMQTYRDRINSILLAPNWMDESETVEKFRGIYMPFHLLRFGFNGSYTGEATESKIITEHHKKYDVERKYRVENAPVKAKYDFIPVDASSSFPDNMSRALCPFTKKKLTRFQEPFLAGYYADSSDVPADIYAEKYTAMARDSISREKFSVDGASLNSEDIANTIHLKGEYHSSLLPVWFLSYRNKNRINYAAVNGDTGELVTEIPIDFKKYLGVSLVVAALFCLILNIFAPSITPGKFLAATSVICFFAFFVARSLLNQTYRRIMHYDDVGYTGVDVDKIKPEIKRKKGFKHVGLTVVAFIFVYAAVLYVADDILGLGILEFLFIPALIVFVIVTMVINGGVGSSPVKKKKAPLYKTIFTLIKPVLGILAAVVVAWTETISDTAYYLTGIFAIVMIILTAFDVVRIQNRYTMRDIPLFTAKRGGE